MSRGALLREHEYLYTDLGRPRMAKNTYKPLATVTLTSNGQSVTFSSIPSNYKDLVVVASGTMSSQNYMGLQFNGSTSYDEIAMAAYSSTWESFSGTRTHARGFLGENESVTTWEIYDYSATDKFKAVINRGNGGTTSISSYMSRWNSTDPITSITVEEASVGVVNSGTIISLYGIEG